MATFRLNINGSFHSIDVDADMPLLWAIRDYVGLTGTKYSCGIGQCGSCTVLIDGTAVRSCLLPTSNAEDKSIVTIEGISEDNSHPVQQAWIEEQVPQCGYCQSGQILSAVALIDQNKNPTNAEIDEGMKGVLCRCGTYPRIRKAIKKAAEIS